MRLMVTGGAGYIGSHAVRRLLQGGHEVLVVDDLSRGNRSAVPAEVELAVLNLANRRAVAEALKSFGCEAVVHFAALAYVGESVEKPLEYHRGNVATTLSLLEAMGDAGVEKLVFSSSCATYGTAETLPLTEDCPQRPINPYGWTKLYCEQMIRDFAAVRPAFSYLALRYFNVAGASLDGSLGEDHRPETHLVPNVLLTALGRRPKLTILGNDYPTPDGTCVRDYIHVEDVAEAHRLALEMLHPGMVGAFNLSNGRGYSNLEIVQAAEKLVGKPIPVEFAPRRPGDPPTLFASAEKFHRATGWTPARSDLGTILRTAFDWFSRHPNGYDR